MALGSCLCSNSAVFEILRGCVASLERSTQGAGGRVSLVRYGFLVRVERLLRRGRFLAARSRRVQRFCGCVAGRCPCLTFAMGKEVGSLVHTRRGFGNCVIGCVSSCCRRCKGCPAATRLGHDLDYFQSLVTCQVMVSVPGYRCRGRRRHRVTRLRYLCRVTGMLPNFLRREKFATRPTGNIVRDRSPLVSSGIEPCCESCVSSDRPSRCRSLRVAFCSGYSEDCVRIRVHAGRVSSVTRVKPTGRLKCRGGRRGRHTEEGTVPENRYVCFSRTCRHKVGLLKLSLTGLSMGVFTTVGGDLVGSKYKLFQKELVLPCRRLSEFRGSLVS